MYWRQVSQEKKNSRGCGKNQRCKFQATLFCSTALWLAAGNAENSIAADKVFGKSQSLGAERLFIGAAQRSSLDKKALDKTALDEPETTEKLPSVAADEDLPRPPSVLTIERRRTQVIFLNGVLLRPDGKEDVWVNGAILGSRKNAGIRLIEAQESGPVVLAFQGQHYRLYPGQRRVVSFLEKVEL